MSTFLPTLGRWGRAAAGAAGLALLTGCDLNFWRMDGHQSTIVVDGPVAREQLHVFYVTCWVTLVIFILVGGVLAYATFKFRARTDADEHAEPPAQSHGNPMVELGLIGASVLALVIIAIPTLKAIWSTYDVPEAEKANALDVTATGYQWWFKFEYPSELAPTGAGDAKAPLVTANELVIPAGRPVRVHLRTVDVIHSFWVPKLAGKVDMIPNRANFLWMKADKPGYFWGQCAEYCGDSHAVMRFRVIALEPARYQQWLEDQSATGRTRQATAADAGRPRAQFTALRTFRQNEAGVTKEFDLDPLQSWIAKQEPEKNEEPELIAKGRELFTTKTCIACHAVRGHGAAGVTAPDLTHFGSRTTVAGGLLENNTEQLRRWLRDPGAVKPGNKMAKAYVDNKITLTTEEEVALTAYLESLK
jgi:cytochrome c oxidase subunit II